MRVKSNIIASPGLTSGQNHDFLDPIGDGMGRILKKIFNEVFR